jgi:hypothetical protein
MYKTSNIERAFYGILTGISMFGAYFLIDLYLATYDPEFHAIAVANQMYYLIGTFLVGIFAAQIYFWYYRKGIKLIKKGTV